MPLVDQIASKFDDCAASGMIAFTYWLRSGAGATCVYPGYERPNIPTLPSDHGCWPTHCCVS